MVCVFGYLCCCVVVFREIFLFLFVVVVDNFYVYLEMCECVFFLGSGVVGVE